MSENINREIYTELANRIYDLDGGNIAPSIYYGLTSLQHRGQESCGMAVSRTDGERGNVQFHKNLGLVSEVLRKDVVHNMNGDIGIGHVRYSTTGESVAENAQPLVLSYIKGSLALAHNGNLVNTEALKWELIQTGAIFHTTTDSEVIAFHIARERVHSATVEEAVHKTVEKIRGPRGQRCGNAAPGGTGCGSGDDACAPGYAGDRRRDVRKLRILYQPGLRAGIRGPSGGGKFHVRPGKDGSGGRGRGHGTGRGPGHGAGSVPGGRLL